jgi:hypothetical protein
VEVVVNPFLHGGLEPELALVEVVGVRADLDEDEAGAVDADAGLAEEVAGFGAGEEFVTHGGGLGFGFWADYAEFWSG